MTGEMLFGAFCVAWLTIGAVLLTAQLFTRLRGIDQLRQLQGDEANHIALVEADIRAAETATDRVETEAKTVRRMIHLYERRLEAASALHLATVAIPMAAARISGKVTTLKLPRRPRFE